MSKDNSHHNLDLFAMAHRTMVEAGFEPDFSGAVNQQLQNLKDPPLDEKVKDLRSLLWSSIDDAKSRDLDQVEYAASLPSGDVRLLVAIADVDALVPKDSPIDQHAAKNCTSVYTGIKMFPMLPEELSTDRTSLVANEDRRTIVTELLVAPDGTVKCTDIYSAVVRNKAKLAYESIGAWLDGHSGVPAEVKAVAGLEEQLRLQHETAKDFAELRKKHGALEFGTIQSSPVMQDGRVVDLAVTESNAARDLIANFMIGANVAMAKFLEDHGGPSLRRVVHTPKFWPRIVEIAAEAGGKLPAEPDSIALAEFLARQKQADPNHFPDLSLAIIKSLGPGEYEVQLPGEQGEGHFGLAVEDYTHSTAPNRRFADLVTQRLVKAAIENQNPPYNADQLKAIAAHCTEREDAARKVQRKMRKVAAALLLKKQVGQRFSAIVTGVTEKGTFARIVKPPVDGRVVQGEHGMHVGDKVGVRLLSTDPQRGFIDFARA